MKLEKLQVVGGSKNKTPPLYSIARSFILPILICGVICVVAAEHEEDNYNSHLILDEEIFIDPQSGHERTNTNKYQIEQTTNNKIFDATFDRGQSTVQIPESNSNNNNNNDDPFAFTFEDYYNETSKINQTLNNATKVTKTTSTKESESTFSTTAIPSTSNLIIEDEDNLMKTRDSTIIDYIFPAKKQEIVPKNLNLKQSQNKDPKTNELLNEIKLLFGWKRMHSSKCSKACGKGHRLYQLTCVDLKYDVRVEDDLCLKSSIEKPSDLTDEPCNEFDCDPEWKSIDFQECDSEENQTKICKMYKKLQCIQINKHGVSIQLNDSRCNENLSTESRNLELDSRNLKFNHNASRSSSDFDEYNTDFIIDAPIEENNKNNIHSNVNNGYDATHNHYHHSGSEYDQTQPKNEPFFVTGSWSECSGASCGELGRRTRNLSCRLILSQSSKAIDLPLSSCQGIHQPDIHEPCYIDCPPEVVLSTKDLESAEDDGMEETVYDLEMSKFNWRHEGWTKCSADCLGGKRESIIGCWDNAAQTAVESSHCDQQLKPKIVTELCNDIPCQPEWQVEPFSGCSKTCGSSGVRTRHIACVQRVPKYDGSDYMVVSNELCIQMNGSIPHSLEPCNRIDCKPEWSVGPWSECSKKCGEGIKNRTVMCVQEFASREGPTQNSTHKYPFKIPSPDLKDAIAISAKNWFPSKVTQIPFHECYEEYRTIPQLDERCFTPCKNEPYIDSDNQQNFHMTQESMRRKTVVLKIGGTAQVLVGRNVKIRCRVLNRQSNLVKKLAHSHVEWRLNGLRIFANGSTTVDKQYIQDDNSILGEDVVSVEDRNQFLADEPSSLRTIKFVQQRNQTKARNLKTRSWDSQAGYDSTGSFNFVPTKGGRYSLVKENTLRIKRLKPDDSGLYTCSFGPLSESIELSVIGRRNFADGQEKSDNNLGF